VESVRLRRLVVRTAAIAIAAVIVLGGRAYAHIKTVHSVTGVYTIGLSGFAVDNIDDNGEVALTGVLDFNGKGAVTGADLEVTYGNGLEAQTSCPANLATPGSTYTVSPDGTGTINLQFQASGCFAAPATLQLFFTLRQGVMRPDLVISTAFSNWLFATLSDPEPLSLDTLALHGEMEKQTPKFRVDPPKFKDHNLRGKYTVEASGIYFDSNDDFGAMTFAGLLDFDGKGNLVVTPSHLEMTLAETGSDINGIDELQTSCALTISASTYAVNLDGTATMTLNLVPGTCFATPPYGQPQIQFFIALRNHKLPPDLLSSTDFSNLIINATGETIDSLVLSGQMDRQKRPKPIN
jgi:hypothetical protein